MRVTSGPPHLTIDVTSGPQVQRIVLIGEADLLGAPKIEAALQGACAGEPGLVVVDLKRLTFIDSSGLHALLAGHELCCARGRELRVVPGPENVQRLFELTGMDRALPFIDSADTDAEANFSSEGTTPRART
jgi:anti-sigma B factor antagonist